MNKDILFEYNKIKKYNKVVIIATSIVQLLFLYFFTIVGRFEAPTADNILNKYSAVVGLASTITICSLTIYGTIVINSFIVCNFIGDSRARTYLYPGGRNKLYYRKTITFIITSILMLLIGSTIANIIFFVSENITPILQSNTNVSQDIITFVISPLVIGLIVTTMVIISSIAGIYFSSTTSTIIAGIIFVVFFGNLIAISFIKYQYILLLISTLMVFLDLFGIKMMGNKIRNDEILYK